MKEELFYELEGRYYLKKEYYKYFKDNKISIKRNEYGSFFVFYSKDKYFDFIDKFELPDEIVCLVKQYSNGEFFVNYSRRKNSNTIDRGDIVEKENWCFGNGIYCITEDDFENEDIGEKNLRNHLFEAEAEDNIVQNTISIFKYSGAYYICVHGEEKENIVKLDAFNVNEDNIIAILEETIEVKSVDI